MFLFTLGTNISLWELICAFATATVTLGGLLIRFYTSMNTYKSTTDLILTEHEHRMDELEEKNSDLEKELRSEMREMSKKMELVSNNISIMSVKMDASNQLFERLLTMQGDKNKEIEERLRELKK